jgi:hypothetical protein
MINLYFKQWLEMTGTGAVYDGTKPKTFNWWGSPGSPGVSPKEGPIQKTKNKKKRNEPNK